jgi:hypothetical protein
MAMWWWTVAHPTFNVEMLAGGSTGLEIGRLMMRRVRYAILVLLCTVAACSGAPMATTDSALGLSPHATGMVTALVGDSVWTGITDDARHEGGMLWITATGFGHSDEDRQHIRLAFQTTLGVEPQQIGPGYRRSAGLTRDFVAGWLAEDSLGSGTITVTTLTPDRATGTFTFTGITTAAIKPETLVVTKGQFNVRLR